MLTETARTFLRLLARGARRLRDDAGSTSITFAIMVPVIMGAVGLGVDYVRAAATRTKMQAVADAAAISSARELQMAKSDPNKIAAIATNYVTSQLPGISVQ